MASVKIQKIAVCRICHSEVEFVGLSPEDLFDETSTVDLYACRNEKCPIVHLVTDKLIAVKEDEVNVK